MLSVVKRTAFSFRFLWKFVSKEIKWLSLGIVLTISLSLLFWAGPRCIGWIIDFAILPNNKEKLLHGVLLLLLIEVGRLATVYFSQRSYAVLGQNVIEHVRGFMIKHILKLPISYLDKVSSGKMMTRIVSDVNSLSDFFQSGLVSVLGNVANIAAIFFGLITLNLKLGFSLGLAFFPILIACVYFSKRLKRAYEISRDQLSRLNSMLADFLFGMKTIRSLSINKPKYEELNQQIQQYAHAQVNAVKTFALFQPALSLGIGILLLIHIVFGLPLVELEQMKVGEWIAGLSYIMMLHGPLAEISDRWNFFLLGLTSIDRIIDSVSVVPQKVGSEVPSAFSELEFKEISFGYRSGQDLNALTEVSFKIKSGDWIGIYGESGSGKSTLLQLIFGFYEPHQGHVYWNGKEYSSLNTRLLTQKLGVVEQFPFLFSGTVLENLSLFGNQSVDLEALKIRFLGLPIIQNILSQPDLVIHERGNNISMGQKQMIAFLRAYLSNPEIWILDEATAFFDARAEEEVMKVLNQLHKEKPITVIQVAHRAEALAKMPRWFQMKTGRLLEVSPRAPQGQGLPKESSDPSE